MKENKIMGYLWLVIAILLLLLLIFKMGKGTSRKSIFRLPSFTIESNGSAYDLLFSKEYSTDEIKDIDVNLSSESLYVEKSNSEKIVVEVYAPESDAPAVETYESTLKIQGKEKIIGSFQRRYVTVKLPENYKPSDLDIHCTSGVVSISDSLLPSLDCRVTSGSIKIQNCVIDKMDTKCNSGSYKIEDCEINDLTLKSTSGSVSIEGEIGSFDIQSNSGSVRIDCQKPFTKDSEINVTSGSVRINVSKNQNCKICYSNTSGSYYNEITGCSGKRGNDSIGTGGPELNIRTTSGSIRIE